MANGEQMCPSQPGRDLEAEVFRELYPVLRRHAAVVGSIWDDPDDLVHEALCRVLQRQSLLELSNRAAYLRRAITNLVIDGSRRRGVRAGKRHLVAVEGEVRDEYPSDLRVLDELSPIDRSILYMVDVEGRSFAEAAEVSGCSAGAARLRASRARKHLRKLLKETD